MPSEPMNPEVRMRRATLVTATECWEWQLTKDRVGYGRLMVRMGSRDKFRSMSAHRYAYEVFVGEIPEGMNVLHKCDNRACCNPSHLFIGTQQDNMRDMYAKGRGPKGYKRDPATCSKNSRKRFIDAAMKNKP